MKDKYLVTSQAYLVWTIAMITSWLSFVVCIWLAVVLRSALYVTFSVVWIALLIMLVSIPGATKQR